VRIEGEAGKRNFAKRAQSKGRCYHLLVGMAALQNSDSSSSAHAQLSWFAKNVSEPLKLRYVICSFIALHFGN
jgi:hypothetical protein